MTTAEYTKLSWRELAIECVRKHEPHTMGEFWLLVGIFAMEVGRLHQVPEKMLEILDHAFAFRDAEIIHLLRRMIDTGRLRGA